MPERPKFGQVLLVVLASAGAAAALVAATLWIDPGKYFEGSDVVVEAAVEDAGDIEGGGGVAEAVVEIPAALIANQDSDATVVLESTDQPQGEPVSDEEVILDLPAEKIGAIGDPEERLPDAESAPVAAIEDCRKEYLGGYPAEDRITRNEKIGGVSFTLEFKGLENRYALMSTMCQPGEKLALRLEAETDGRRFEVTVDGGDVNEPGEQGEFQWVVPGTPGIYCCKIVEIESGETMCLHGLVCVPYHGEDRLEGYKIGSYKTEPLRGNPRYERPAGFVRVGSADEADVWISPHFQLRQFLCKQSGGYPKFVLVESRLLLKLEKLLEGLEEKGIETNGLYITSGFRTPAYNVALGNKTFYSRHLYGDAADIFVDRDENARLDDLNGDGKADDKDAGILYSLVEDEIEKASEDFVGGLGFYKFKPTRTAFVHLDTRGYAARWGK